MQKNPLTNFMSLFILLITCSLLAACNAGQESNSSSSASMLVSKAHSRDLSAIASPGAYSPSGRYAYVVNSGSNTVGMYTIAESGIAWFGDVRTGLGPKNIAFTQSGQYAYVNNLDSNTISMYRVTESGLLIALAGSPVAAGSGVNGITITPDSRYFYVANTAANSISMYSINDNGTLAPLSPATIPSGSTPQQPTGITIGAAGKYAYALDTERNRVYSYKIEVNGQLTHPEIMRIDTTPQKIALAPNGKYAYVISKALNANLRTYAIRNGELTPIGDILDTGSDPTDITISPSGRFAYVTSGRDRSISIYSVNTSSGQLTANGTVQSGSAVPAKITIDPTEQYSLVTMERTNAAFMYGINATTGALTSINRGITGTDPYGINISSPAERECLYIADLGNPAANIDGSIGIYKYNDAIARIKLSQDSIQPNLKNPSSIVVSPSKQYAYVTDQTNNSIFMLKIAPNTCYLSAINSQNLTVPTGAQPSSITVTPDARYVYTTNKGNNTISMYSKDDNGLLSPLGSPVSTGISPRWITTDPSGQYAYVTNYNDGTVSMYRIGADGALAPLSYAPVATNGGSPEKIIFDRAGPYAFTVNTLPSPESGSISVFKFTESTGQLFFLGKTIVGRQPKDISIDASGEYLSVANYGENQEVVYKLDRTTLDRASFGTNIANVSPTTHIAFLAIFAIVFVAAVVTGAIVNLYAIKHHSERYPLPGDINLATAGSGPGGNVTISTIDTSTHGVIHTSTAPSVGTTPQGISTSIIPYGRLYAATDTYLEQVPTVKSVARPVVFPQITYPKELSFSPDGRAAVAMLGGQSSSDKSVPLQPLPVYAAWLNINGETITLSQGATAILNILIPGVSATSVLPGNDLSSPDPVIIFAANAQGIYMVQLTPDGSLQIMLSTSFAEHGLHDIIVTQIHAQDDDPGAPQITVTGTQFNQNLQMMFHISGSETNPHFTFDGLQDVVSPSLSFYSMVSPTYPGNGGCSPHVNGLSTTSCPSFYTLLANNTLWTSQRLSNGTIAHQYTYDLPAGYVAVTMIKEGQDLFVLMNHTSGGNVDGTNILVCHHNSDTSSELACDSPGLMTPGRSGIDITKDNGNHVYMLFRKLGGRTEYDVVGGVYNPLQRVLLFNGSAIFQTSQPLHRIWWNKL